MEKKMMYKSVCTARELDKDGKPCDNYTVTDTEGREIHFVKFPSLPRNATLDNYFSELPGVAGSRSKTNPTHFWFSSDCVSTDEVVSEEQKEIDRLREIAKDATDKAKALKNARKGK